MAPLEEFQRHLHLETPNARKDKEAWGRSGYRVFADGLSCFRRETVVFSPMDYRVFAEKHALADRDEQLSCFRRAAVVFSAMNYRDFADNLSCYRR